MIKIDLEQGSPEWTIEKLGKPSASNIAKIITSTGKTSTTMKDYLYTLVAERITGQHYESFKKTECMEIGNEREEESRKLYEMLTDSEVEQVGVVYKDEKKMFLCSPDGLVGDKGLELKNVMPKTQVKYLIANKLPTEYFVQVQFSMYVTGFKSWDFFSYCPAMPHFLINVPRDDLFIQSIEDQLVIFISQLDSTEKQVRNEKDI